jgi:hypothetical protein
MLLHVLKARYLDSYRLYLEFNNGVKGSVNLEKALWGDVFSPLKQNIELFKTAHIDPVSKTVAWKNGADLASEYLLSCVEEESK